MLSKVCIEFETGILCTADFTANITFFSPRFIVSIGERNYNLLAPPACKQSPKRCSNKYDPNYTSNNALWGEIH